jgi:hypothetical protein
MRGVVYGDGKSATPLPIWLTGIEDGLAAAHGRAGAGREPMRNRGVKRAGVWGMTFCLNRRKNANLFLGYSAS